MTLVVDASVVMAAMVDNGPVGRWAEALVTSDALAAPHLMPVEVANILRRAVAADRLTGRRCRACPCRHGESPRRIPRLRTVRSAGVGDAGKRDLL